MTKTSKEIVSIKQQNNISIPNDWEVVEFGDFAKIEKAKYVPNEVENLKCIELEHFEQETGSILGWKNSSNQKSTKNVFKKGQVLFGKLRPYLQKYWLAEFDGVCSSEVWVLNSKNGKCSNEFLFRLIQHNRFIQATKVSTGSKMPRADWNFLSTFPFALPPLPEQRAIAACLNTWDKAIDTTQKLIAQKELRKKWLMQQLLTGKKRLKGYKRTEWQLKSLEEVAEFKNGKGHERVIDENGRYIVVNSKFISSEGIILKYSNKNLSPLFYGDIVMVMSDVPNGKALSKCFHILEDNKFTLNQRICSIKAYNNTDSRFLYYILNRNIYFLSFDNGVGQTNLRKNEVLECPVLLPEKPEQTAIAQVLQSAETEIKLLKNKLDKLKTQKKGLMQVLLTGRKRLVGGLIEKKFKKQN